MGVFVFETETKSPVAPALLFKAFALDADNVMPKALPDHFKGVEIIEGNGGPGTIKKLTLSHGSVIQHVKHKIESIDEANLSYKHCMIEGDMFKEKVEKISYEVKIEASGDGGSIFKNKTIYHTKGDCELKEEDVKEGKEKSSGLFKAIEAYLLANPNY